MYPILVKSSNENKENTGSQMGHTKNILKQLTMIQKHATVMSWCQFHHIKCMHFLYERLFSSYVLALNKLLYKKFARLTLMKLTPGRVFLQIFKPIR